MIPHVRKIVCNQINWLLMFHSSKFVIKLIQTKSLVSKSWRKVVLIPISDFYVVSYSYIAT